MIAGVRGPGGGGRLPCRCDVCEAQRSRSCWWCVCGKGHRFIDRNGVATISGGHLTLRKSKGDVIADAPITAVRAQKARFSAGAATKISIGEERYAIEPLRVRRFLPGSAQGAAVSLQRDLSKIKEGKELTKTFLALLAAEGGHVDEG